jgi:hypothetical protein
MSSTAPLTTDLTLPELAGPRGLSRTVVCKLAVVFGLGMIFLAHLSGLTFVDPDLFHEMALAREFLTLGHMPLEDRFAYTPTVNPSVHHEWGTGLVLYLVATTLGSHGIMLLKYALTIAVVTGCYYCARRRGANFATIALLCAVPIVGGCMGFTTIRAQLFTMFCLVAMLIGLDQDRAGNRRWLWWFVPLFVCWLNLHAGFVVGAGLIGVHAVEQCLRRQPSKHLFVLCGVLAALVIVNPYGWLYYPYLAHGLLLPRPMIIEWRPLWQAEPSSLFHVYLFSVFLALYCVMQLGWRRTVGVLVLLVSAYAAVKHTRHLSIYFVVWLAYVPGWLQETRLGRMIGDLWDRRKTSVAYVSVAVGVLALVQIVPAAPWKMRIPTTSAEEETGRPMYPTGPVEHLRNIDFRGNLMVPFVPGAFVSWKLHPQVKVSLDGRYEVAYQRGILEENEHMYQAKDGWRATLDKYPTDVLLVPRSTPLAFAMERLDDVPWTLFYRDAAYDMYSRPGLSLPSLDRGATTLPGVFP